MCVFFISSSQAAPKEKAALEKQLWQLQEDLEFVEHFPRDRPYMSVLKTPDRERVDKMRRTIKELMQTSEVRRAEERRRDALGSEDEEDQAAAEEDDDDFFVDADEEDGSARRAVGRASGGGGGMEEGGDSSGDEVEVGAEKAAKKKVGKRPKERGGEGEREVLARVSEEVSVKKKRDKKLPDRNRKAKKNK